MIKELFVYADGRLVAAEKTYRCALGPGGVTASKKEGDGCTPAGSFPLREVLYRSDRLEKPDTELAVQEIRPDDSWCTESSHAEYNTQILLPHSGAYENLWREDDIYDIVVPLGYNDSPAQPGKGSAIFFHIAREEYTPTEGCVAVSLPDMLEILKSVSADAVMTIMKA